MQRGGLIDMKGIPYYLCKPKIKLQLKGSFERCCYIE